MNDELLSLASDLESGGITKKLAAQKIREWVFKNPNKPAPYVPIPPSEWEKWWPDPSYPYSPNAIPTPNTNPVWKWTTNCPKCGMVFNVGTIMFSCQQYDCPVFTRITC